jgi:hypothetical protein
MDQHVNMSCSLSRFGAKQTCRLPLAFGILWLAGWGIFLPVLAGCSPESRQNTPMPAKIARDNHVPSIRAVRLMPDPLKLGAPIVAEVDADDLDGDFLRYEFRWWINDQVLRDATGPSIGTELLKKSDKVMAEIVAFDGKDRSASFKTEAVIQNSTPAINRVALEFEAPAAVPPRLKARVGAVDHDGDDIHYVYRWWRNDALIKESHEDWIDIAGFARKDSIVVEVTARDQDGEAAPYRSSPAVVGNAPPRILTNPSALDPQGDYQYRVQAHDPDGDPLVYGLETAPPGMAIDAASGQISWTISSELAGTHRVKIHVDDGQGGVAWQEFEISIPATESSSTPSPRT